MCVIHATRQSCVFATIASRQVVRIGDGEEAFSEEDDETSESEGEEEEGEGEGEEEGEGGEGCVGTHKGPGALARVNAWVRVCWWVRVCLQLPAPWPCVARAGSRIASRRRNRDDPAGRASCCAQI